ncbi:unnamed protein product [Linum trigynum]|uniref:Uncharacterized protein n=1 Tax=Linum trigynum TaxID=586398 RepID=A0AAV2GV09_9ROSI
MSSCIDMVPEQLCYIPCNFCNIVLAVSVPCSNLLDIVTVRCGHCTNLWSVNMAAAFQYSLSSWHHHHQVGNGYQNNNVASNQNYHHAAAGSSSSSAKSSPATTKLPAARSLAAANLAEERIINRPPEKRQRVPSAYNQFIKEEIQRIKANNPDISHREAFSTAAKNWAHFPHIHFGLMLETNKKTAY